MPPRPSERNREVFEQDAPFYARSRELFAPERDLLRRLRDRWPAIRMLDLGVGAGRTAWTFAALARSYVGVDYVSKMVELSRALIGEDGHARFEVGDARDLSAHREHPFDVVLFSYNGIDCVNHADRLRVLAEIRSVLEDDGWFAFSSHSLHSLPLRVALPPAARRPTPPALGAGLRWVRASAKAHRVNRELDLAEARRRGWTIIRDTSHDFRLDVYYVSVDEQIRQLEAAGFADIEVRAPTGEGMSGAPGAHPWLFYTCRAGRRQ